MTEDQFVQDNIPSYNEVRILKKDGYYGTCFPFTIRLMDSQAAVASNYSTPAFIADRPYELLEAFFRHEQTGAAGSSVDIFHVPNGTAPGSGSAMIQSVFNLDAAINTVQTRYPAPLAIGGKPILAKGDSIALRANGTITDARGVTVTVVLKAI